MNARLVELAEAMSAPAEVVDLCRQADTPPRQYVMIAWLNAFVADRLDGLADLAASLEMGTEAARLYGQAEMLRADWKAVKEDA